jgi:hypothetical protein
MHKVPDNYRVAVAVGAVKISVAAVHALSKKERGVKTG